MKTWGIVVRAALSALCASFAYSASAQDYVGIGFGGGRATIPSLDTTYLGAPVTATPDKTRNTGFKVYFGHLFTPNWGIEVGGVDLGSGYSARTTVSGAGGKASGSLSTQYVALAGTLPVGKRFSLLGKVGLAANNLSSGTACTASVCVRWASQSHTAPLTGIGVQYRIAAKLGLRFEYEDYGKMSGDDVWGTGDSGAIKANSWYLAAQYLF